MFDDLQKNGEGLVEKQAVDLLNELEKNTPDEIRRQRKHFRVSIKAPLTVQPGNASDTMKLKLRGVTGDVSEGGLGALFSLPLGVGDIYRLEFERSQLDLPTSFARCVRCRLLREQAYESGFVFFTPVALPANVMNGQNV